MQELASRGSQRPNSNNLSITRNNDKLSHTKMFFKKKVYSNIKRGEEALYRKLPAINIDGYKITNLQRLI